MGVLLIAQLTFGASVVVYNQPMTYVPPNGSIGASYTSLFASGVGGFRVSDSFTIQTDAQVESAKWYGMYWDYQTPAANPAGPNTSQWQVNIYADNAGVPGAPVYSATPVVTTVQIGTSVFGADTVGVYEMSATLPGGVNLKAGVKYWFSVVSVQANPSPLFSWIQGSGGDSNGIQQAFASNGTLQPGGTPFTEDRAFALYSTSINSVYQVRYLANINVGDSYVNITNTGTINGADPAGQMCANVYVFDPNEEPVSCCSCPVTPNGLVSLSARKDLISNPLTPGVPTSLVVKVLFTANPSGNFSNCNAGGVKVEALARGGVAWATTLHANTSTSPAVYQETETPFDQSILKDSELSKLVGICNFIQTYASKFGLCNTCRAGAQGAAKQ